MEDKIKICDLIFIAILIMIVIISSILIFAINSKEIGNNAKVYIEVNGSQHSVVPLSEDTEINIENVGTVIIEDSKVRIENALCNDKVCEHMGEISKSYQSIICLPNRTIIKIISNSEEFDDIAG